MSFKSSRSRIAPEELVFETIEVGMTIPELKKNPTSISLFMFSAALWITHRAHFDQAYQRSVGHKNVLIHGPLQAGYLIQMVTDWIGESGELSKMTYRHHKAAYLGDELTSMGIIRDKRVEDGKGRMELDLWIENQEKAKVTSGAATVYIPLKKPD